MLRIRAARRGAFLAAAIYLPIAIVAAAARREPLQDAVGGTAAPIAMIAILSGVAGVALLGAGLAPAALGSRIDAVVVGVAIAIGGSGGRDGVVRDLGLGDRFLARRQVDLAAPFLRAGVIGGGPGRAARGPRRRGLGRDPAPDQPAAAAPATVDSAAGHSRTLTSSPRRIRPGCSTSASTPKSACLPSRRPRYEMIVRNVSRSRSPVSGSCVVIAQRAIGLGHPQDRVADGDPAADPGVLLVRSGAFEVDEHPEPARIDLVNAGVRGQLAK